MPLIFGMVCITAITAVPAFATMWTAPGLELNDCFQREGLALWQKIVSITP
jgi:hypothetical protein